MILSQQSGDLDILLEHNVEIFVAGSKKIIEVCFLLAKIQELDNEQKHADEKRNRKNFT